MALRGQFLMAFDTGRRAHRLIHFSRPTAPLTYFAAHWAASFSRHTGPAHAPDIRRARLGARDCRTTSGRNTNYSPKIEFPRSGGGSRPSRPLRGCRDERTHERPCSRERWSPRHALAPPDRRGARRGGRAKRPQGDPPTRRDQWSANPTATRGRAACARRPTRSVLARPTLLQGISVG